MESASRYGAAEASEVWRRFSPATLYTLAEGVLAEATVLVVDLVGFTQLTRTLGDAQRLVQVLDVFHGTVCPVIAGWYGIVNNYTGDGFMALFGGPFADALRISQEDARLHALAAGANVMRAFRTFLDRVERQHSRRFDLHVTLGLHSGELFLGLMGNPWFRQLDAIGDAANVAFRLQQGCPRERGTHLTLVRDEALKAAYEALHVRQPVDVPALMWGDDTQTLKRLEGDGPIGVHRVSLA